MTIPSATSRAIGPGRLPASAWVWAAALAAVAAILLAYAHGHERPLDRLRAEPPSPGKDLTVYRGSWYFPRGGPYNLGFYSPPSAAEASLRIDGREVARGRGAVTSREVFPRGVVAVELRAPAGALLMWHPPGRRGPLEYVPASSLSPEPPEKARFDVTAGTSPGAGAAAAAILVILLSATLFTMRDRLRAIPRRTRWLALAVFAVALAVRCYDLGAAGATWDEDVNWSAGRNYAVNVLDLDAQRDHWQWNYEHPPVTKYVIGVGALFADGYGPARFLSALAVAIACALLVVVVERLYGARAAGLAGLIAAFSPHLIAHGQIAGHEAMAILLWTACAWIALGSAPRAGPDGETDRVGRRELCARLAAVGVALGLAVFSRFVNVLVAPLIATILIACSPPHERKRVIAWGIVIIPAVALALGYVLWPRLWTAPITGLVEAWHKLEKPHGAELFLGAYTNQPPRTYFFVYLIAATPLGILLLALVWAGVAVRRRRRADLVLLAWLLAPMLVALSPVRQDGVRYILPSLVALSACAGAGGAELMKLIATRSRPLTLAVPALLAAYLAITAWRVHPYYLDYYGEHVGGPRGVYDHHRFELAWWGEGLDRAIDYVNDHAAPGDAVYKQCVIPSHLTWLRTDLWATEARRPDRARWIVVYQPYTGRCPVPAGAERVFEVDVMGAPLAQVYRRD